MITTNKQKTNAKYYDSCTYDDDECVKYDIPIMAIENRKFSHCADCLTV